ncbi:hypothetical protein TgHK011_000712 [Trichoderma gracile]|nr:hypothetical protein TgHK011_000712 [Trichoderma gracile]
MGEKGQGLQYLRLRNLAVWEPTPIWPTLPRIGASYAKGRSQFMFVLMPMVPVPEQEKPCNDKSREIRSWRRLAGPAVLRRPATQTPRKPLQRRSPAGIFSLPAERLPPAPCNAVPSSGGQRIGQRPHSTGR